MTILAPLHRCEVMMQGPSLNAGGRLSDGLQRASAFSQKRRSEAEATLFLGPGNPEALGASSPLAMFPTVGKSSISPLFRRAAVVFLLLLAGAAQRAPSCALSPPDLPPAQPRRCSRCQRAASVRRTLNALKPRRLASLADRLRSCGPQFLHALSTSGSSSQDLSHQPQVAQQKVKAHGHCGNGSSQLQRLPFWSDLDSANIAG